MKKSVLKKILVIFTVGLCSQSVWADSIALIGIGSASTRLCKNKSKASEANLDVILSCFKGTLQKGDSSFTGDFIVRIYVLSQMGYVAFFGKTMGYTSDQSWNVGELGHVGAAHSLLSSKIATLQIVEMFNAALTNEARLREIQLDELYGKLVEANWGDDLKKRGIDTVVKNYLESNDEGEQEESEYSDTAPLYASRVQGCNIL